MTTTGMTTGMAAAVMGLVGDTTRAGVVKTGIEETGAEETGAEAARPA
jgi:hypothetical protein